MVNMHIVKIRPMKIVVFVKRSIAPRVCKVDALLRLHRYKNLNQGKYPRKNALIGVLFDLCVCRRDGHTAFFKLDVDEWHPIDKQHHIATAVIEDFGRGFKEGLLHDLVAALPCGYLLPVINLEADLFSQMQRIVWVVSDDRDGLTVDKTVEFKRCFLSSMIFLD